MLKIDNHTLLSSLDYLNIAQAETYSLIKELSVDTGAPCPVAQSVGMNTNLGTASLNGLYPRLLMHC